MSSTISSSSTDSRLAREFIHYSFGASNLLHAATSAGEHVAEVAAFPAGNRRTEDIPV